MATVMGTSQRTAIRTYLRRRKPSKGDIIAIKPRGHGDWQELQVY